MLFETLKQVRRIENGYKVEDYLQDYPYRRTWYSTVTLN